MNAGLYRSDNNAVLGGVCTGLGDFLDINPVLVRAFFLLMAFGNGIGALLYVLLWIIIPLNIQWRPIPLIDSVYNSNREITRQPKGFGKDLPDYFDSPQGRSGVIIGFILFLVGLLYLLSIFNLNWLSWFDYEIIWPVVLIFGGLALLLRRPRGE